MDSTYVCDVCKMEVCLSEPFCPFCQGLPKQNKRLTSKLQCKSCGFENDLSNDSCVACQTDLFDEKKKKCELCGFNVKQSLFDDHSTNCLLSMEIVKSQKQILEQQQRKKNQIQCEHCKIYFPPELLDDHYQLCQKIPKKPVPIVKPPIRPIKYPLKPGCGKGRLPYIEQPIAPQIPVYDEPDLDPEPFDPESILQIGQMKRMSKLQNEAVLYMHKKSRGSHNSSIKSVQTKSNKLGFKNSDLQNLHYYIQNYAPIIIHCHITRHMQFFIKDTHYRSQFETGKSSGSLSRQSRIQWEDRMFDKKYSKAKDSQRVKYGVINFTNDPKGVNCALGYGQSYFLLKNHVRARCTMTDKDSSASDAAIGTFKSCFHVLNKMNDKELKSAYNAAKALQESSSVTSTYKQIQIHGPVEFAKDIERLYVNKKQVQDKKFLEMVYKFHELFGVEYEFI